MSVELCRLHLAVDRFAIHMKEKLLRKCEQGWTGWRNPEQMGQIRARLAISYAKFINGDIKQAVDVANLTMFLAFMPQEEEE